MVRRAETGDEAARRVIRDGYDVKSYSQVHEQVRLRREKANANGGLIQRLRAFCDDLRTRQGDPRDFATLEQLIIQVRELKAREVGPAPQRLVASASDLLAEKRASFFGSAASRTSTSGGTPGSDVSEIRRKRSQRERFKEQAQRRARHPRSFCNPLGATMWVSKEAMKARSSSGQIGSQNRNLELEHRFIADAEVAGRLGMPTFNALAASKSDPCMSKYFGQSHVSELVKANNPRRESMLGYVADRTAAKSTLREYLSLRNEMHGNGHCKHLVASVGSLPKQKGKNPAFIWE